MGTPATTHSGAQELGVKFQSNLVGRILGRATIALPARPARKPATSGAPRAPCSAPLPSATRPPRAGRLACSRHPSRSAPTPPTSSRSTATRSIA
jgi:hypothetical protein